MLLNESCRKMEILGLALHKLSLSLRPAFNFTMFKLKSIALMDIDFSADERSWSQVRLAPRDPGSFALLVRHSTRYFQTKSQISKEIQNLVRMRGVEPPRPCEHYHLKVACIPFHHIRE